MSKYHLFLSVIATALLSLLPCRAEENLLRIETRPSVQVPIFYMKHPSAAATVVLLPGGAGGFGKIIDGKPDGRNFLVRSRDYFFESGFNVAIIGKPSDKFDLDFPDRIATEHMTDIRKVVDFLRNDHQQPIWLIGSSRGSVSATAAAIAFGNENLAGIVLTSSIVSIKRIGAVPLQNLAAIRIPVLVVHNANDACKVCSPTDVPKILAGLIHSPHTELIWMQGGGTPNGDPCEAYHYHGFIDIEKETVSTIANWIKSTHLPAF